MSSSKLFLVLMAVAPPPMRADILYELIARLIESKLLGWTKTVINIDDLVASNKRKIPPSIYCTALYHACQRKFAAVDVNRERWLLEDICC